MLRYGRIAVRLMMLAPLCAGIAASCKEVPGVSTTSSGHFTSSSSGTGGSGGGSSGTGASGEGGGNTCRTMFEDTVLAEMQNDCGTCHDLGGPADAPFLAAPDPYVSITAWPGVIVPDPEESIIVVHPDSPTHGGPNGGAPPLPADLKAKIIPWLTCEASRLPNADGGEPGITPFLPRIDGAMNEVDLDPLGTPFMGASITFIATTLPAGAANPSLLVLSDLTVYPIENTSITIQHPLFTIYEPDGSVVPDPADSFSDLDETFTSPGPLGTGTLILSQWQNGARLGIEFEQITDTMTVPATENTCVDMADFQSDVVPQIAAMYPCFMECHGGGNPMAQQQMDLSTIMTMSPPDQACSQVRARITPGDPSMSQILIVTNPTVAVPHLFKFGGNLNDYNAFKAAVTPWIMGEAQ